MITLDDSAAARLARLAAAQHLLLELHRARWQSKCAQDDSRAKAATEYAQRLYNFALGI